MLFASLAAAQMSQSSPEVPTASDEAAPSCPLPEGEKVDFSILASACRKLHELCDLSSACAQSSLHIAPEVNLYSAPAHFVGYSGVGGHPQLGVTPPLASD